MQVLVSHVRPVFFQPPPDFCLTTQHLMGGGSDPPPPPPPLGPPPPPLLSDWANFSPGLRPIKIFSGAFGASKFRPKNLFGAFGTSNNSGSPEPPGPPPDPPPLFKKISGPHSPGGRTSLQSPAGDETRAECQVTDDNPNPPPAGSASGSQDAPEHRAHTTLTTTNGGVSRCASVTPRPGPPPTTALLHRAEQGERDPTVPCKRTVLSSRAPHGHGGVSGPATATARVWGLSVARPALCPDARVRCSQSGLAGEAARTSGGRRPGEALTQPNATPPPPSPALCPPGPWGSGRGGWVWGILLEFCWNFFDFFCNSFEIFRNFLQFCVKKFGVFFENFGIFWKAKKEWLTAEPPRLLFAGPALGQRVRPRAVPAPKHHAPRRLHHLQRGRLLPPVCRPFSAPPASVR